MDLPLVKGGLPEDPEGYDVVVRDGLKIYVPKDKSYEGDVPRLIRFRMKDGTPRVGVTNEQE